MNTHFNSTVQGKIYTLQDIIDGEVEFDLQDGLSLDVDIMDETDGSFSYVAWVSDNKGKCVDGCSSKDQSQMLEKILTLAAKYEK